VLNIGTIGPFVAAVPTDWQLASPHCYNLNKYYRNVSGGCTYWSDSVL